MSTAARVLEALGEVYDPELDEPITDLRFVTSCDVSPDGDVDVRLRLPTPQCAPNFAFLMVSDARTAIVRVPGVRTVQVVLEDHYTGREINDAVSSDGGFEEAFPGETTGQVDALRSLFHRKALVARQWRIYERLVAAGERPGEVASWLLAELPAGDRDVQRCDELRRALGIDVRPESPAFVRPDGSPVAGDLDRWRRAGRLINTSLETNGGMCRSLLQNRHGLAPEEVHA
ncbi:iron-sulfur cluster assembly protein [Patulibacter sp. NPDC049589]|uniref:metal-sulfur cluster assembly factor n=1 Tax=Patulibacter sp. NPDC049589 TaxID=3154731 RepID=UPI00342420A7